MDEKKMSIELTFHILGAIGSIMSGIIMLITLIQVLIRLKFKNEVIYGDEAKNRYDKIINTKLVDGIEIKPYVYEGGNNKIVPRLEVEKIHYNPILMKRILKGYKIRVRYFYKEKDKDDKEIRKVITWYLKSNLR